jgi:hypothetical protein
MNRPAEPGERLSEECGHHCGISQAGNETPIIGHCGCGECHDVERIKRELIAEQKDAGREAA